MKHVFTIFIVNPLTGEFVLPEEWANNANPTSADVIAIERTDGTGILLGKRLARKDGEIVSANWDEARKLAAEFTSIGKVNAPEGFRLPDRRECLDIYDARFQGLDKALELIGGDPVDGRWIWTDDEDPDPEYTSYNAFLFTGNYGHVDTNNKYYTTTVRPVSAFLPF